MSENKNYKEWTMPEWMEKYRGFFNNTGGNSVEELMNDHSSDMFTNPILAALCISCHSQVALLTKLHADGLIE